MRVQNLLTLAGLTALAQAAPLDDVHSPRHEHIQAAVDTTTVYDTLVVGGGPSGLAALSSLARVRRTALLVDSAEYRNAATRHMHDVPGFDGVTPAYYRYSARQQISHYDTVTMTNGTVTSITSQNTTEGSPLYTAHITGAGLNGTIQAKSVILGTGVVDTIPNTPGLMDNWGKGIYWCPWCDGTEHADQSMGILAPMGKVSVNFLEIATLNSEVMAFVNGTDTPENRAKEVTNFGADWETYLKVNNITIYNQTIVSITRLRDGSDPNADPALPTVPEHDLFRIDLDDGTSIERNVFLTSFGTVMRGTLGQDMGVATPETGSGPRLAGDNADGYMTNVPLVYAVGDNNLDATTNVAHALYTGKKAAVYAHGKFILPTHT